jgi:hypothetical protein
MAGFVAGDRTGEREKQAGHGRDEGGGGD